MCLGGYKDYLNVGNHEVSSGYLSFPDESKDMKV